MGKFFARAARNQRQPSQSSSVTESMLVHLLVSMMKFQLRSIFRMLWMQHVKQSPLTTITYFSTQFVAARTMSVRCKLSPMLGDLHRKLRKTIMLTLEISLVTKMAWTLPLHCRLLDERNSVSVSAGADEYTHFDGLERNRDPEDEQLVIIDGWQDLLDILHQHTPSPDFLIHLEMYGLHITHHSIRITECEATIAAIREAYSTILARCNATTKYRIYSSCASTGTSTCSSSCSPGYRWDCPPLELTFLRMMCPFFDVSDGIVIIQWLWRPHTCVINKQALNYCLTRTLMNGATLTTEFNATCTLNHVLLWWPIDITCYLVPCSRFSSMMMTDRDFRGLLRISRSILIFNQKLQQPASGSIDVLQEWLAECSCSHVALVMYGLFGSSLGTRYATSQADYQQVRSVVLHVWQDYVHPETSVTLLMVRPQDDQQLDHLHLIVEFTRPSQARPAGYLPILQRISWHNIWQGDTSAAVYRVSGQNMRQLLAACSLSEWCGPSTRAMCRIQVERQLIPISDSIELQAGSLLEILVSLQHSENDEVFFLQGNHNLHSSSQFAATDSVNHPHVSDRWCDDLLESGLPVDHGSQDGSKNQVGPPILTCRPNAAITLEFDDFIPLANGGRIIPPPNWRQNSLLRYASSNEAVFRNGQGFLTVDCRTWLLPHGSAGHRQPRDLRIQAQLLIHLPERIRRLWRDFVAPGDAIRIQHVRPTPLARGNQQQLPKLHLLVEVNRPLGDISRPVLFFISTDFSSRIEWWGWLVA